MADGLKLKRARSPFRTPLSPDSAPFDAPVLHGEGDGDRTEDYRKAGMRGSKSPPASEGASSSCLVSCLASPCFAARGGRGQLSWGIMAGIRGQLRWLFRPVNMERWGIA